MKKFPPASNHTTQRVVHLRDDDGDPAPLDLALRHAAQTFNEVIEAIRAEPESQPVRGQALAIIAKQTADLLDELCIGQPDVGVNRLRVCRYQEIIKRIPSLCAALQRTSGIIALATTNTSTDLIPCLSAEFCASLLAIVRAQLETYQAQYFEIRAEDLCSTTSQVRITLHFGGLEPSILYGNIGGSGLHFVQHFALAVGGTYRFTVENRQIFHELTLPAFLSNPGSID